MQSSMTVEKKTKSKIKSIFKCQEVGAAVSCVEQGGLPPSAMHTEEKISKICMDHFMDFVDIIDCYFFIGEADILNAALGNYKSIIAEGYIGILMCLSPWSCKDKSSRFA